MPTIDVCSLSVLPTVDLGLLNEPEDGVFLMVPKVCRVSFAKSPRCREHYESLTRAEPSVIHQCPNGLASVRVQTSQENIALTAFIPFPRQGGRAEREQARRYPDNKVSSETIQRATAALHEIDQRFNAIELETFRKYSLALHEIRKLNRTVKQGAERLARRESPSDPDLASPNIVQIWKASDLMSQHFDVLEILANEKLAELPLNTQADMYRMFDKCARIYRPYDEPQRINLSAPPGFRGLVDACDKTFSIIPTVLLQNAIKYSLPKTPVAVKFEPEPDGTAFTVSVSNVAPPQVKLDESVFRRGVRGTQDKEGSGLGLYVAQLVARQHGTLLTVNTNQISAQATLCTFSVRFLAADPDRRRKP